MALVKLGSWIAAAIVVANMSLAATAWADTTLTIGHPLEIRSLDPRVTPRSADEFILYNVFDPLLNVDEDGNLVAGLATKWEIADDSKSVTLHLREDVTFHDGTPLNAEAVKYTFDSIMDPELGSLAAIEALGPYERTEVIDEYTARVVFSKPFSPFVTNATTVRLAPVSPTAGKSMGHAKFAEAPVGTGPYKVEEWVPRDRVVLVRNDAYEWAPDLLDHNGPAHFDKIIFRILPDAFTRVSALESGEADMVIEAPVADSERLRDAGFKIMAKESPGLTRQYFLNTANAPTDEPAVREAILHAVDRQELADRIYFSGVTVAYSPYGPTTLGYWKDAKDRYPYDPKKAEKLLDEAGWKVGGDGIRERDGKKLVIEDLTRQQYIDDATLIQSQLRKIGIDWKINVVTTPVRNQRIQENDYNSVWGFWPTLDPDIARNMFYSANIPTDSKFGYSWSKFNSPKIDDLLDQGVATLDPQERVGIYEDLQKVILDNALTLPVLNSIQNVAYSTKLEGLKFHHDPYVITLYDAKFKE